MSKYDYKVNYIVEGKEYSVMKGMYARTDLKFTVSEESLTFGWPYLSPSYSAYYVPDVTSNRKCGFTNCSNISSLIKTCFRVHSP